MLTPVADRLLGRGRQIRHRALEAGPVVGRIEQHRQRRRTGSRGALMWRSLASWSLSMIGYADLDLPARLRRRLQQIALRPDGRLHRRDELLANRVERRIRHLREELREVVVEQARTIREHGERRVVAHRPDRLFALSAIGADEDLQVLFGVAEELLPASNRVGIGERQLGRVGQVLDRDQVLREPVAVRMRPRQLVLDLVVVHDPPLGGVDEEDLARMQPLLDAHVLGRDVEHARLGRHDDEVVLRHRVARRTQAVAVEHGADHGAIGERDRRRAVPRLHQRRVELVEGPPLGRHALVSGPRLGNHHQDGVRQRAARHDEELEHVVERRRVAAAFADDRQDLLEIVAEELGRHQRFARLHPVDVAAQRVDLAVVGDVPIRMRQRPRRKRVRAEALVHERERRLDARVAQIREHPVDLIRDQHALVDERPRREADDVERARARDGQRIDGVFEPLANDVQLALERRVTFGRRARRGQAGATTDEHLLEHRLDGDRARADVPIVGRHVAPADQALPFLVDDALEERLDVPARTRRRAAGTRAPRRSRARAAARSPASWPRAGGIRPASESGCRRRRRCSPRSRTRRDAAG